MAMISLSRTPALSRFELSGPRNASRLGTRIGPCPPMPEPIVEVTAALPQPSRRRWADGGAATVIRRPRRPGSRFTTGSGGWWSGCRSWKVFTCFARASTSAPFRRSGRCAGRRARRAPTRDIRMMTTPSTSTTNQLMRSPRPSRARRPAMSDNPRMRRFRPRWLSALLGGIVLPFDPVLGMVMIMVGLWPRRRQNTVPRVLKK